MTLATLPCDVTGHQLKETNPNQYFWTTQKINDVIFRQNFKMLFPKFKEGLQNPIFKLQNKITKKKKHYLENQSP
jgi:hypothetical protein